MIVISGVSKNKLQGEVIRIEPSTGYEKYLWIKSFWETPDVCKGKINPQKEVKVGDYLKILGIWKIENNPKYHYHGQCFIFQSYEIIPPPQITPPKIQKTTDPQQNSLKEIKVFLKLIGALKIDYDFLDPKHNSISQHVRNQLIERVVKATPQEKDLYFLSSFLDRNTLDCDVQNFRKNNPDFKEQLINCWNEDHDILLSATKNIERVTKRFASEGFDVNSHTFEELYYSRVPGRFKFNQILICLKVINEKYSLNRRKTILDILLLRQLIVD